MSPSTTYFCWYEGCATHTCSGGMLLSHGQFATDIVDFMVFPSLPSTVFQPPKAPKKPDASVMAHRMLFGNANSVEVGSSITLRSNTSSKAYPRRRLLRRFDEEVVMA